MVLSFSGIVVFLDELFTLGAGCGGFGDFTSCRPCWPVRPTTRKSHREHAAKRHESFSAVKWMISLRHRHTESLAWTTYLRKTKSRLPVPPHRFPDVAGHCGLKKSHVNLVDVSLWTRYRRHVIEYVTYFPCTSLSFKPCVVLYPGNHLVDFVGRKLPEGRGGRELFHAVFGIL